MMKRLCYIQARAGSKRFPGKNKAPFDGLPLYRRVYNTALCSGVFDAVVISTDDDEIHADRHVSTIPRSTQAASDTATDDDVARDVLNRMQGYDIACKLYPTAVILPPGYFTWALEELTAGGLDGVRGVMEYEHPPERAMYFTGRYLTWEHEEYAQISRRPERYYDCGAFMMFRTERFYEQGTLDMDKVGGVVIPWWHHQDINTEADLEKAGAKYGRRLA